MCRMGKRGFFLGDGYIFFGGGMAKRRNNWRRFYGQSRGDIIAEEKVMGDPSEIR